MFNFLESLKMKKTIFLSFALLVLAFSSSASANSISYERKIDCMGEFVSLSTILQIKRSEGENVSFSDIHNVTKTVDAIGYNFGKSLQKKDKTEQDRLMKLLTLSLEIREKGLLRQVKSKGVPATLKVVLARTDECSSELGEFSDRRL